MTRQPVTVWLPQKALETLRRRAEADQRSISGMARRLIELGLAPPPVAASPIDFDDLGRPARSPAARLLAETA